LAYESDRLVFLALEVELAGKDRLVGACGICELDVFKLEVTLNAVGSLSWKIGVDERCTINEFKGLWSS